MRVLEQQEICPSAVKAVMSLQELIMHAVQMPPPCILRPCKVLWMRGKHWRRRGGEKEKKEEEHAQCEDCGVRADAEALLMKYMVQHTPHEEKAEEED
jgi:hypothetical protein